MMTSPFFFPLLPHLHQGFHVCSQVSQMHASCYSYYSMTSIVEHNDAQPTEYYTFFLLKSIIMRTFWSSIYSMVSYLKKSINIKTKKNSWKPFKSCLLNCTATPVNFHSNWAGLAVIFSRQLQNGYQDFFLFQYFNFNLIF